MAYPFVHWAAPTAAPPPSAPDFPGFAPLPNYPPYMPPLPPQSHPFMHPYTHQHHYAIPAILPSSSPFVANPQGAIRDLVENVTNGDRDQLCDAHRLKWFEDWGKNEEYRKIIMDVLKVRMELSWPYNYKALDILAVMPVSELPGVLDKLTKLNETSGVEGFQEIKKVVKPLIEKAEAEKKKNEEEEMKKREAAVMAMWGGMWANDGFKQPTLAGYGWGGFPYPYSGAGIVPGVSPPGVEWKSNAPAGWQPYVFNSGRVLCVVPVIPFPKSAGGSGAAYDWSGWR